MSLVVHEKALEEMVEQQINLGHKNPHEFYDLLVTALGDDLVKVVEPYIADFISEMARQKLNSLRRASVARITATSVGDPETMLHSLWIPSEGSIVYKRIADMTPADFDARAAYLERMASGIHRHAQWCRDVASLMRQRKVKKALNLGQLPPLPEPSAA